MRLWAARAGPTNLAGDDSLELHRAVGDAALELLGVPTGDPRLWPPRTGCTGLGDDVNGLDSDNVSPSMAITSGVVFPTVVAIAKTAGDAGISSSMAGTGKCE